MEALKCSLSSKGKFLILMTIVVRCEYHAESERFGPCLVKSQIMASVASHRHMRHPKFRYQHQNLWMVLDSNSIISCSPRSLLIKASERRRRILIITSPAPQSLAHLALQLMSLRQNR